MWKLIHSEFSYLKWILLPSCLFLYFIGFYTLPTHHVYRFDADLYSPWEAINAILPRIIFMHLGINFALIYLSLKEHRLRQTILLPVNSTYIGFSKIALPLMLALSLSIVAFVPFVIITVIFQNDVHLLSQYYSRFIMIGNIPVAYMGGNYIDPRLLFNNYYWSCISLWFFFVYGFWLYSEKYGRILLITYAVFMPFYAIILPIFKQKLVWDISEYITSHFLWFLDKRILLSKFNDYSTAYILACGFAILIYISFMRRRSYFW
jgi:hypothetical protein